MILMIYNYRDKEIQKTIDSAIEKADGEVKVFVKNADDVELKNCVSFNEDWKDYHGCGLPLWELQQEILKQDEDIIAKSDPHMRFEQGWDTYYKENLERFEKEYGKVVIHSRCLGYHLDGKYDDLNTAYSKPLRWNDSQIIELAGTDYEGFEKETYFMNAGFMVFRKSWLKDVGWDKWVAMWGEETDLSMRSFLNDYHMIHIPAKIYHLFGRQSIKGVDSTREFELMNRQGIERVKIKLGFRDTNPNLINDWDIFGVDGRPYYEQMKKEIGGYALKNNLLKGFKI